jgi:hypothetical protein
MGSRVQRFKGLRFIVRKFVVRKFVVLGVVSVVVSGCAGSPLQHAQPSALALGNAVLEAVARRDDIRLRALALDESEFKHRIWPALPAARPERNLPFGYVWTDLRQKSEQQLRQALRVHGGRRRQLEAVRFDGKTSEYGSYRVHRETVLVLREASGPRQELRVIGSMVEADGLWKVFSYVAD